MPFSSPPFFVFFALYLVGHLLVPLRYRLFLIIIGGTIFYSYWNPAYVWVPHVLTAIAFFGALWMGGGRTERARRWRLIGTVIALFLPLAFFKYANFLYHQVIGLIVSTPDRLIDLPLPLGISFVTFTLVAYVVEVYRGSFSAQRGYGMLTGHVVFFPHLINGPILRPHELLPQLEHPRRPLDAGFLAGAAIFSVGLVKKLVFADPMSAVVNAAYAATGQPTAGDYALAIYGYSLQIYCDFSGYTDMALGLALLLGIQLPQNFNRPYAAASIIDFWRGWHISLSMWFRDYVYIPLGGNRRGLVRQGLSVLLTMGLVGLWHGASWTFIVWGVGHGLGIATAHSFRSAGGGRVSERMPHWLGVLLTFHFVSLGWVFFRAQDLATAWRVVSGPFTAGFGDVSAYVSAHVFPLCLLAVFFLSHRFDDHRRIHGFVNRVPAHLVWLFIGLMWVLAITISGGSSAKFIYFDF